MKNESHEPQSIAAFPALATLPQPTRHDGWTGERMAAFCEGLAETAVVEDACDRAGMAVSGAYALRRRNPVFAAAWDAALRIARERLADTLLARSMEGNREQIWRDGEIVGERHVLDNRLGLAILRRLDRRAETGLTVSTRGERFAPPARPASTTAPASLPTAHEPDWDVLVEALRTGDEAAIAAALAIVGGGKVEEVEDPPVSLSESHSDDDEVIDQSDRCWKDEVDNMWLTDFPPPAGFDGYESSPWGSSTSYERACTPDEVRLLEANQAAIAADERTEEEELRDTWFALLADEAADDAVDDAPDEAVEDARHKRAAL